MKTKIAILLLIIASVGARNLFAAFVPVCERTPAVRDFLVGAVKKECAVIEVGDLIGIKRVAVPGKQITQFKAGDFSGLPALEILNILGNPYTELPEGLLSDLPSLKTLVIFGTDLKHLPDDFLEGLTQLENLHIFDNPFKSISESVFVRLASFRNLKVLDFSEVLNAAEKERLRRLFPVGGVVELTFY